MACYYTLEALLPNSTLLLPGVLVQVGRSSKVAELAAATASSGPMNNGGSILKELLSEEAKGKADKVKVAPDFGIEIV
jgi:hypothetical protein